MDVKERDEALAGGGFFQSQVSFNLEEGDEEGPVQKKKPRRHRARKRQKNDGNGMTACPGCGSAIDREEFIDCISSFALGAHDHMIGDPVRARFIQSLRNEVSALPTPRPREGWILEITHRIEHQMHILLEAEKRRMRAETETNIRSQLELEMRQRIEREIWSQVEAVMATHIADSEE